MKAQQKKLFLSTFILLFTLFSTQAFAQSSCCAKGKEGSSKSDACCSSASTATTETSGCSPSNCRGAQTKFGEAKVITTLRESLVSLKADMELSTEPVFDKRTYDIHGIVGESDEQSLQIIVAEVKLIEKYFSENLNKSARKFKLPKNKAKQVAYVGVRIDELKTQL